MEVSSHGFFRPDGIVDTRAPNGETGHLLLDPIDVTISTALDSNSSFSAPNYDFFGQPAVINNGNLSVNWGNNNVSINTSRVNPATTVGGGVGDVTINADFSPSFNGGFSLTITADHDIICNELFQTTGVSNITLQAGHDIKLNYKAADSSGVSVNSGTLTVTAENDLFLGNSGGTGVVVVIQAIGPGSGKIIVDVKNDIIITGPDGAGDLARIDSHDNDVTVTSRNGNIILQGGASTAGGRALIRAQGAGDVTVNAPNGNIQLISGAGTAGPAAASAVIDTNASTGSGGNITIDAGRSILLDATSGGVGSASIIDTANTIASAINITAGADLILRGGANTSTTATIRTNSSASAGMTFSVGRDVKLISGTAAAANAIIGASVTANTAPILFSNIGGDLVLQNNGFAAHSAIGGGNAGAATTNTGPITFSSIGGNVTLIGATSGAGALGEAQIGHFNATVNGSVVGGNIELTCEGSIRLVGGSQALAFARIGHGGQSGTVTFNDFNITVAMPVPDVREKFLPAFTVILKSLKVTVPLCPP